MGRKRIELGPDAVSQIRAMKEAGHSAEAIADALGISPATVKRRIAELKGKVPPAAVLRPKAPAPELPRAPTSEGDIEEVADEVVTEGTSLAQIDEWLKVARERANAAADHGDSDNHIKYMRLAAMLLEAKRKATPIPKADPNEHPDMVEAAERVREKWHALAESLVRVSKSQVAETIARILRPKDEQDERPR